MHNKYIIIKKLLDVGDLRRYYLFLTFKYNYKYILLYRWGPVGPEDGDHPCIFDDHHVMVGSPKGDFTLTTEDGFDDNAPAPHDISCSIVEIRVLFSTCGEFFQGYFYEGQ